MGSAANRGRSARSARHLDQRDHHAVRTAGQPARQGVSDAGRSGARSSVRRRSAEKTKRQRVPATSAATTRSGSIRANASSRRGARRWSSIRRTAACRCAPKRKPRATMPVRTKETRTSSQRRGIAASPVVCRAACSPRATTTRIRSSRRKGYVVILYEMIHDARIIPIDGSRHPPASMRLWNGDSRGRWEGNTLVVDTTNYNDKGLDRDAGGSRTHQRRSADRVTPRRRSASRRLTPTPSTTKPRSTTRRCSRGRGRCRFRCIAIRRIGSTSTRVTRGTARWKASCGARGRRSCGSRRDSPAATTETARARSADPGGRAAADLRRSATARSLSRAVRSASMTSMLVAPPAR